MSLYTGLYRRPYYWPELDDLVGATTSTGPDGRVPHPVSPVCLSWTGMLKTLSNPSAILIIYQESAQENDQVFSLCPIYDGASRVRAVACIRILRQVAIYPGSMWNFTE